MKNIRRITFLIITILLVANISIFADFQTWIGTGLISTTNTIDSSDRQFYQTYIDYHNERRPAGSPEMSLDELKSINMLGPSLDLSLFPDYRIPIGIKISNHFLFPVGMNSSKSFRTHYGDMKYRLLVTLDYAQQYTANFGMFAGFGFEFEHNMIAKSNKWNSTEQPDFHHFSNYGLYGELGLLTTINNGYFKLGIDYNHSLKNNDYSYSMLLSGGFRF